MGKMCGVYLCDDNGTPVAGFIPREDEIVSLLIRSGLTGRYGLVFQGRESGIRKVPFAPVGGDIRVSSTETSEFVIAIRSGGSNYFQWYYVVPPDDIPVSDVRFRLAVAVRNPTIRFPVPEQADETPVEISGKNGTHVTAESMGVDDVPEGDASSVMSPEDMLLTARDFVEGILSDEPAYRHSLIVLLDAEVVALEKLRDANHAVRRQRRGAQKELDIAMAKHAEVQKQLEDCRRFLNREAACAHAIEAFLRKHPNIR